MLGKDHCGKLVQVPGGTIVSFRIMVRSLLVFCIVVVCALVGKVQAKSSMNKQPFGPTADGQAVDLFTLTNSKGMEVAITNFGGIVVSLKVPDRSGKLDDVVLGYDQLDGYLTNKAYFGALIGRYGNRIAHGQFKLEGTTYNLPKNDGDNKLNGGTTGFNKRVWTGKDVSGPHGQALELTYL